MIITTLIAAAGCAQSSGGGVYDTCLPQVTADGGALKTILQIVFGVLAAVAVLMVTIGALRLVTSDGNPDSVKTARGTILYALIGLIVAISAEALVAFFLGKVK